MDRIVCVSEQLSRVLWPNASKGEKQKGHLPKRRSTETTCHPYDRGVYFPIVTIHAQPDVLATSLQGAHRDEPHKAPLAMV
jgi:hypothetical protein